MAVLVSFIYEKNGEQVETVHSTVANDFTRDDLITKFNDFLRSLGYVFPDSEVCDSCPCAVDQQTTNFELE